MRFTYRLLLSSLLSFVPSSVALAQDPGQVGITMGYPTAVGVIWHVSDSIAIRPEVNVTTSTTNVTLSSTSATAYGVGISGLFYVKHWDALRAYVAPRYAYQHGSATSSTGIDLPFPLPIDLPTFQSSTTTSQHNFSGLFGAQYLLHRHFGVFGEVGATYTNTTSTFTTTPPTPVTQANPSSHAFGFRSGVGGIFYF
ncbi:MAG TPA: hypothetical protein VH497_06610 [Vicinamibacterales bacterium]|jgi:hypothetical protein